jgi:hypothetical protein
MPELRVRDGSHLGNTFRMRQVSRTTLGVVLLVVALASCDRARDAQEQIQEGVDAAKEAVADAADAVGRATRSTYEQVASGVNELQADLSAAANEAGDQAQQTYQDLLQRAEDLRAQADAAGEHATADAQQAWQAVSDALAELEADIRDATNG